MSGGTKIHNNRGYRLRNAQGEFVLARTEWSSPMILVHEWEALGLLKAIKWSIDLGLEVVSFELDCKMVVDHIKSNKEDVSEFGYIIAHVRQLFL